MKPCTCILLVSDHNPQVLSLCEVPELLHDPRVADLYPADVIERAKLYTSGLKGGLGAYTESPGAITLRKCVAEAVERRDGFPCNPENLFLTDGASPCVHYILSMIIRDSSDAFMVPIPQYPLYSAALALYGGQLVPYMLDEDKGWGMDMAHLKVRACEGSAGDHSVA